MRILALVSALLITTPALADGDHTAPPWHPASSWPDRIVATPGAIPTESFAVTWRTDRETPEGEGHIVKASGDARFDLSAKVIPADLEVLNLKSLSLPEDRSVPVPYPSNRGPVHYHSVRFTGLEPDTLYSYRVGSEEGGFSEWFQLRTAPVSGPVDFLYFGDAQNGILSHWARTVREGFRLVPQARFIIHAGDMVNRGSRDLEWSQWFKAVGFIHGMLPAIPVAGNHEYDRLGLEGDGVPRYLSIQWRPQFTLPENPAVGAAFQETVYKIPYNAELSVFVLDTQGGELEAQARWLDEALKADTATWRIVTMHHPVFSSGRDRDSPKKRAALLPVLKRHNVDMVLQGHDHTYARGRLPMLDALGEGQGLGPVFVNSVSGAKMYPFQTNRWDGYAEDGVTLQRLAENTQLIQHIRIDGNTLSFKAYDASGELYDRLTVEKDGDGRKRVVSEMPESPERRFDNTGPYPGAGDLNLDE